MESGIWNLASLPFSVTPVWYVLGMETMQLIHTPDSTDLMTLSNTDLEAFFADAGLAGEVVDNCDDARCPTCFAATPAKAA